MMNNGIAREALKDWLQDNVGMVTGIVFDNEGEVRSSEALEALNEMMSFVESIATMKQDGETGAGDSAGVPIVMENDDAVSTLNTLISNARALIVVDQADSSTADSALKLPTRDVYFACFSSDQYPSGPTFGAVEITPALVARIERLTRLCEEHNLSEVREWDANCDWGPYNISGELCLENDELVVTRSGFWWRAAMGQSDGHVETRRATLEQLRGTLHSTSDFAIIDADNQSELLDVLRRSRQKV